ncbi:outer membrane beta-barrel protein [Fulvivirgaceae bacterium PWU4]|uniref:Outer membrane beta-barrel protein n=1 Tax=Chryseosolibacter histidini TaxID=2782349 RepID=A0AAP2DQN7_9BACT|nr:outer membrane beta-barrel protein [Chryseosolibacter histidini]MBT1698549.1 outer membrane beta-barrel protein [Chryseosolibacter histidini]
MRKLILFAVLLAAQSALAQEKYFYVALDVNKPLSNTSWVNDGTARGVRLGYRAFINRKFSAGLDLSSSAYDQYKPTETMQSGSGAVTTDYFNYIYSYTAVVSGQYYFGNDEKERFFPYAGLGLGANNNRYVMYYNIYEDSESAWGFLARPEAGVLYKFGRRSLGVMASVHYDYSTNQSKKFGYDGFSAIGFNIGLIFLEW